MNAALTSLPSRALARVRVYVVREHIASDPTTPGPFNHQL